MIYTVTLNPAVDHTLWVEDLTLGSVNRVARAQRDAGGKGINVSKVIRALGGESTVCAILGGQNGAWIANALADMPSQFVYTSDETRTNLKLVDPRAHMTTDINASGSPVPPDTLDTLRNALCSAVVAGDVVVLSGSLPCGAPPRTYAEWTRALKARGARVIVDASGQALAEVIAETPALIKPNRDEICQLFALEDPSEQALIEAGRALIARGIGAVVISLGADGALFLDGTHAWRAEGLPIRVGSTVGAGDAMVAALALSLAEARPLEEAIPLALATSAAAATTQGSDPPKKDTIEALLPYVRFHAV